MNSKKKGTPNQKTNVFDCLGEDYVPPSRSQTKRGRGRGGAPPRDRSRPTSRTPTPPPEDDRESHVPAPFQRMEEIFNGASIVINEEAGNTEWGETVQNRISAIGGDDSLVPGELNSERLERLMSTPPSLLEIPRELYVCRDDPITKKKEITEVKTVAEVIKTLASIAKVRSEEKPRRADDILKALWSGQVVSKEDINSSIRIYNDQHSRYKIWPKDLGIEGCKLAVRDRVANVVNINLCNKQSVGEEEIPEEMVVMSPLLEQGFIPAVIKYFVGGNFPPSVIGISFQPTIVITRDTIARRNFTPGYRLMIFLSEPGRESFDRFCSFFDKKFREEHATLYGENYLSHLMSRYNPKYC